MALPISETHSFWACLKCGHHLKGCSKNIIKECKQHKCQGKESKETQFEKIRNFFDEESKKNALAAVPKAIPMPSPPPPPIFRRSIPPMQNRSNQGRLSNIYLHDWFKSKVFTLFTGSLADQIKNCALKKTALKKVQRSWGGEFNKTGLISAFSSVQDQLKEVIA